MNLDTTDIETLMGNLKDEYAKKAVEPIESFSQEDTLQIEATDDRMNYLFIKPDDINHKVFLKKEYLDLDKIDYGVVIDKQDSQDNHTAGLGKFDTTLPASFFNVKSVEDGTEYYMRKNPDLPEGVAEIMARYTFGEKVSVKQKPKKDKKKKPDNFEVKTGKFKVDFS
jgi:hypothetical protein